MIKVLIVDDSSFMRSAITRLLSAEKEIEVVGQAKNGKEGLEMAKSLRPDLITLDIEMPIMNGLDMLKELMKTNPTPVLMVSSLTTEGAEATFKALELGALDFIPKYTDNNFSTKNLQDELCQKVLLVSRRAKYMRHKFASEKKEALLNKSSKTLSSTQTSFSSRVASNTSTTCSTRTSTQTPAFTSTKSSTLSSSTSSNPFLSSKEKEKAQTSAPETDILSLPPRRAIRSLIGIGISTGGPPAIQEVLTRFPKNFPVAILIAQHMPASFTKPFAERLDKLCEMHVKEAEDGEKVQTGTVYIAPGGVHMSVVMKGALQHIKVSTEPPTEIYKPSANVLFKSFAELNPKYALGVIMTGMGADGAIGLKEFKAKGGTVIAQDEATCVVYGMPKAVIDDGTADEIKSLKDLPQSIINAVYA